MMYMPFLYFSDLKWYVLIEVITMSMTKSTQGIKAIYAKFQN